MDPSTMNDVWVNLATNSPFLGWMIYSYIKTNKQLDQTRQESKEDVMNQKQKPKKYDWNQKQKNKE